MREKGGIATGTVKGGTFGRVNCSVVGGNIDPFTGKAAAKALSLNRSRSGSIRHISRVLTRGVFQVQLTDESRVCAVETVNASNNLYQEYRNQVRNTKIPRSSIGLRHSSSSCRDNCLLLNPYNNQIPRAMLILKHRLHPGLSHALLLLQP